MAHALFTELVDGIHGDRADWLAHVLLSLSRIDLIDHLVTAEGWTDQQVRDQIRDLCEQLLRGRAPAAGQGWGWSVVQRGESPSKSSSRVASSVRRRSNGGGSTAIHRPRIAT